MIDWPFFHISSKKNPQRKELVWTNENGNVRKRLISLYLISRRTRIIPRFTTPCEMTSEEERRNSILMTCHYPDLGSAYGLCNPQFEKNF